MPELCRFLGIVVAMYYRDYRLRRFRAGYECYNVTVEIEFGKVME